MATAATRFAGYSAVFNGTTLNQVMGVDINPQNTMAELTPMGLVDRGFVGTSFALPQVNVSTTDIAVWLALNSGGFASAGLHCTSDSLIQFQKRALGGVFDSSGHGKCTAAKGLLYPRTLSVDSNTTTGAVLECIFVAYSDGTETSNIPTKPLIISTSSVTLTGTPAINACFFQGPVLLDTTELTGCTRWAIDFGLTCHHPTECGWPYPLAAFLTQRHPMVSVTYAGLPSTQLFGEAASGAGVTLYLRKGVTGGTRVASNASSHVSLAFSTGALTADSFGVQGNDDGTTTLQFRPTSTISVNTATALP